MLSMPPEYWAPYAEGDKQSRELVSPPDGALLTYTALLERADPTISTRLSQERFDAQYAACQRGIEQLSQAVRAANVDTLVVIGDDQDELFYDDNMPAISVYWGEEMPIIPREPRPGASEAMNSSLWGYGSRELEYPIDSALGKHLVESLIEQEFDVAHARYVKELSSGVIGPAGYVSNARVTPPKRQGMIHAFSFIAERILHNDPIPFVPVTVNTCYPPNQITPRRCYALGQAIRRAVEAWDVDRRVGVVGTGGLSHFVVDEDLDRTVLKAMKEKDAECLRSLPRQRLNSAASEIRNWVTAAGALEHLDMSLIDYVPVYRTPAGTGGGWAFATWS